MFSAYAKRIYNTILQFYDSQQFFVDIFNTFGAELIFDDPIFHHHNIAELISKNIDAQNIK